MSVETIAQHIQGLSASERSEVLYFLQNPPPSLSPNDSSAEWKNFIERTYGCLADDPIVRPEQPRLTGREVIL